MSDIAFYISFAVVAAFVIYITYSATRTPRTA